MALFDDDGLMAGRSFAHVSQLVVDSSVTTSVMSIGLCNVVQVLQVKLRSCCVWAPVPCRTPLRTHFCTSVAP